MSETVRQFGVVGERPAPMPENRPQPGDVQQPAAPDPNVAIGLRLLLLATKTVSERLMTAILTAASVSFTGIAVASAWWLWSRALSQPSTAQIVLCALYAVFILAIEWQRRRKGR